MYQTNTAFRLPNTFILDRNRERNAVFYGRVSTEHEAQLAALENQMQVILPCLSQNPCKNAAPKFLLTRAPCF